MRYNEGGMRRRDLGITAFVIAWTLLFHYQTFRVTHLNLLARRWGVRELPKIPLLFPPAGWIMFYRVDPGYGFAEVYGLHGRSAELLEPHEIFRTRALGYDNIRRNVLIGVLDQRHASAFCRYLERKFPRYEGFAIVHAEYTNLVNHPQEILRRIFYQCP